jgi:hypothetical protein
MVNLYFAPDAQLTKQDRMVLDVLEKNYKRYQKKPIALREGSEDSDDSGVKHTRYDSTSSEGTFYDLSSSSYNLCIMFPPIPSLT